MFRLIPWTIHDLLHTSAILALAAALPCLAQSTGSHPKRPAKSPSSAHSTAAPPTSAPTSFSKTVNEVNLDMVVRNRRGKPILDLNPSQLQVTDNGQTVHLKDLHLVTNADEEHLITFVFDPLYPGAAKASRKIADRFLRSLPGVRPPRKRRSRRKDESPAEGKPLPKVRYSFAVMQFNGRLRLISRYTSNIKAVEQTIDQITSSAGNQTPKATFSPAEKQILAITEDHSLSVDETQRIDAKMLLSALENSQRMIQDDSHFPSLTAIEALANSQRDMTGRRIIVWFSQGVKADDDSRDKIKSVVGQANRDGVTILAVDTSQFNNQIGGEMMGGLAIGGTNPGQALYNAEMLGANGYCGCGNSVRTLATIR